MTGLPPLGPLAAWRGRLPRIAGAWHGGDANDDGNIQMPWFEPGPELAAFVQAAYDNDWICVKDWPDWLERAGNRAISHDATAIRARATAEDLFAILTVHIRGDRFSEGHLAAMVETGVIEAVLDRAAVLEAQPKGAGS